MIELINLGTILENKAAAAPGFSFKAIGNEFRLTFSKGISKKSYVIHSFPKRKFSRVHDDWKFFFEVTHMGGKKEMLLMEDLGKWLQGQTQSRVIEELVVQ